MSRVSFATLAAVAAIRGRDVPEDGPVWATSSEGFEQARLPRIWSGRRAGLRWHGRRGVEQLGSSLGS